MDITEYLDMSSASRPGRAQKRISLSMPLWILERLDKQAARLGIPRQSLITVWIADRLKKDSA